MKRVKGSATYYDVLGVTPSADAVVISATYRALIKKYHPDTNGGDEDAAEKARQLNEAYEVLSDADARARYDYFTLGRWSAPTSPSGEAMGFAGAYQFDAADVEYQGPRGHDGVAEEDGPATARAGFWSGGARFHLRAPLAAAAVAAVAMLAVGIWIGRSPQAAPAAPDTAALAASESGAIGGPVTLTGHVRPRLTSAWLAGSWVIEGLSCQGDKVITLAPDGSWARQSSAGRWVLKGGRLHLLTTTLVEEAEQRALHIPEVQSEKITVRGPKEIKSVDDNGVVTIYDRCSAPPPD